MRILLIILLFPLVAYSQDDIDIWGVKGNEVDFVLLSEDMEYTTDYKTIKVVVMDDRDKILRTEKVEWKDERSFDFPFSLMFQKGSYKIKVYHNEKLIATSGIFKIGK